MMKSMSVIKVATMMEPFAPVIIWNLIKYPFPFSVTMVLKFLISQIYIYTKILKCSYMTNACSIKRNQKLHA